MRSFKPVICAALSASKVTISSMMSAITSTTPRWATAGWAVEYR
jgi:hypothetical protein